MYKIGELSKLSRLSVKALRFYDAEGILPPDEIDRFTGYRYYSAAKLIDCHKIVVLKELGFSLDEIKRHLKASTEKDILALVESKRTELEAKGKEIESQLKRLAMMEKLLMEGNKTMYDITIKTGDTIRVAAKRALYASKAETEMEIEKIKDALPRNIRGSMSIIINYETEYREMNIDMAACHEITAPLPKNSGYTEMLLAFPGDTASLVCKREELDAAYEALYRHLDEMDCQITGAEYEVYYDENTVELRLPVCKKIDCGDSVVNTENFENDPAAIGKWQLVDIVPSREQFVYGSPKFSNMESIVFHDLYFLKGGERYWIVEGWTKGKLYMSAEFPTRHTVAENYTIETDAAHSLMFVEENQIFPDGKMWAVPQLRVYEKVSGEEFTAQDIRIQDNTDYPFQPDSSVLGKWEVYDFYFCDIESFNPNVQNRERNTLFLRSVEFSENGKCVYTMQGGVKEYAWTKGLVLNHRNKTASAYQIKRVDGREYLILEWKSGDYTFGGKVNWYILARG